MAVSQAHAFQYKWCIYMTSPLYEETRLPYAPTENEDDAILQMVLVAYERAYDALMNDYTDKNHYSVISETTGEVLATFDNATHQFWTSHRN